MHTVPVISSFLTMVKEIHCSFLAVKVACLASNMHQKQKNKDLFSDLTGPVLTHLPLSQDDCVCQQENISKVNTIKHKVTMSSI